MANTWGMASTFWVTASILGLIAALVAGLVRGQREPAAAPEVAPLPPTRLGPGRGEREGGGEGQGFSSLPWQAEPRRVCHPEGNPEGSPFT